MKKVRFTNDFLWKLVSYELAKEIFSSGLFEVYKLHNDDSESLCECYADINDAAESGLDLAIEVGNLSEIFKN
jgi:hypothetical protein